MVNKAWLGWADEWLAQNETHTVEEEDVLDNAELNRMAYKAEHPELEDPVFIGVGKKKQRRGGGR